MEFRLLGPVELRAARGLVDLGTPRQRHVLAALAVDVGRPVPVETLIDRVWGPQPPSGARSTLHVYVAHVRKIIDRAGCGPPVALVRRSGGYVLDADPALVDVHLFRRLVVDASDPACSPTARAALLRRALDRWDTPLADLTGEWPDSVRHAWRQEYLDAATAWARATLAVGDGSAAVGLLTGLVADHPRNESLVAALMRALYAAGRSAEALDQFARIREVLADELGADPGPELLTLNRQILRGEPVTPAPGAAHRSGAVPALLPPGLPGFAGRHDHLAQLDALLPDVTGAPVRTTVVLSGTAGVGKTTLAVHWAHRVRDRFPDGQLYVNLRGFDLAGAATSLGEAARRFLDALQVPPQRIPTGVDSQLDLYRSLLAGRRMLIVLDNARDTAQVRPLLPGAPGCLAAVTSRNQLTGLIATNDAHPVPLEVLTLAESRELLTRRLGAPRVAAEPDAVGEIIAACARLPLALAIVAARATTRPRTPLATFATELADARGRLDLLAGDDPYTDVRTVFSWSYRSLTPDAARLFRLLAAHPGPDSSAAAAASLAGLPPDRAHAALAELTGANLLSQPAAGRYSLHDLLRAYARDLATRFDTDEERRAASHRVLDHYLHSAHTAAVLISPGRTPIALSPPRSGVTPEKPGDHEEALGWLTTERPVLLAAVEHAAASGFDTHAWQLAWALADFLNRRGHWHDQVAVQELAVAAAQRAAEPAMRAGAHRLLAIAQVWLRRFEEAHTELRRALALYAEAGDVAGQAQVEYNIAYVWERQGRYAEALDHVLASLDLYRAAGHRPGQADALNAMGWLHAQLGDYEPALTSCRAALDVFEEVGHREGAAAAWDSLGYAHHHLGHHAEAVTCYESSLALRREVGDRYSEAEALTHLGEIHQAAGDPPAAREAYRQALDILVALDHPDADKVRARLADLTR